MSTAFNGSFSLLDEMAALFAITSRYGTNPKTPP